MAHLTNFSFEFSYKIFTEDAPQPLLYHGAKKSKMTKNSNQRGGGGGPALSLTGLAYHFCPDVLAGSIVGPNQNCPFFLLRQDPLI